MKKVTTINKQKPQGIKASLTKLNIVCAILGFISVAFSLVTSIWAFFIDLNAPIDATNILLFIYSSVLYLGSGISLATAIIAIVISTKVEKVGDVANFKWKNMRATFLTLGIVSICFPIVAFWIPFSNFISCGVELAIGILSIVYGRILSNNHERIKK